MNENWADEKDRCRCGHILKNHFMKKIDFKKNCKPRFGCKFCKCKEMQII